MDNLSNFDTERKLMNFSEAIELVKQGKYLKRKNWSYEKEYILILDHNYSHVEGKMFDITPSIKATNYLLSKKYNCKKQVYISKIDGLIYPYILNINDIFAKDWIILK